MGKEENGKPWTDNIKEWTKRKMESPGLITLKSEDKRKMENPELITLKTSCTIWASLTCICTIILYVTLFLTYIPTTVLYLTTGHGHLCICCYPIIPLKVTL
ncbi:hypothetical protein BsWGS_27565 [Bradybaena similaris]